MRGGPVALLAYPVPVRAGVVAVVAGGLQLLFQAGDPLVGDGEPALGKLQRRLGVGDAPVGVIEPLLNLIYLAL